MPEPEDDDAFATLLEDWREHLGPEKDEGLGLLWKEGGIEALLELMRGEVPRVMAALARALAADHEGDDSFAGEMLSRYLWAMSPPSRAERLARLDEVDLNEPSKWSVALHQLDPPMPKRFRSRIEAWLDRARGIERRCAGIIEPKRIEVGSKVVHDTFGEGIVTAIQDSVVTVQFATDRKRLRADKLALVA